ncbi:MAG TPA: PEP/pyruvate-binding domain-containing protein, partial [Levilinea sp.]|nr:PEP/pyruvate-binding domain-containing protein [Levilinea sp.]
NLYRWAPQIRREDGFVRLVWGLGTRAVDRVGNDFPRLIALSHPLLRPSTEAKSIRRYSQQYVDLIDLEDNDLKTLPIHQVLKPRYPPLRYLAQVDEDGYFSPLRTNLVQGDSSHLVLTFDELLRRTGFAERMREILHLLEQNYRSPVDLEFTLHLVTDGDEPKLRITILQCRPQSHLLPAETVQVPVDLPKEDIVFSTHFVVPQGYVDRIDYVLFVEPEKYFALITLELRQAAARAVGRINAALQDEDFICIGPGRWGSSNTDLGVPIDYGDIYNASALVELSGKGIGPDPEPSLGTHFFQDLLEAQIYPLAVMLDDPTNIFRREFFYETPNRVEQWIEIEEPLRSCLRLIRVADFRANSYLRLVMNDEQSLAVAYLE